MLSEIVQEFTGLDSQAVCHAQDRRQARLARASLKPTNGGRVNIGFPRNVLL